EIITSDIDNFWKAYDASSPTFDPKIFQKLYFDEGSKGLKDFVKSRIEKADYLSKTILKRPKYYASIRKNLENIDSFKPQIKSIYANLKELYPQMHNPKVYFVVGRMSSGGMRSKNGLLIGAELFALSE